MVLYIVFELGLSIPIVIYVGHRLWEEELTDFIFNLVEWHAHFHAIANCLCVLIIGVKLDKRGIPGESREYEDYNRTVASSYGGAI